MIHSSKLIECVGPYRDEPVPQCKRGWKVCREPSGTGGHVHGLTTTRLRHSAGLRRGQYPRETTRRGAAILSIGACRSLFRLVLTVDLGEWRLESLDTAEKPSLAKRTMATFKLEMRSNKGSRPSLGRVPQ